MEFDGVRALDGVSLEVAPGELFAVIGPNGAGKTSLFNVVSGFYRPSRGRVVLDGRELAEQPPHQIAQLGVARSFQNLELFPLMTTLENLLVGRHQQFRSTWWSDGLWTGRARREEVRHRARVEEIMDFLDLEAYRWQRVSSLPYGVQKRIELGRALAMEPSILLLDEPTAGMNLEETEDVARYILDIHEELGITEVLVEHDMGVVMDLADRVAVLNFGRCIDQGTPAEVQRSDAVVEAYLGAGRTPAEKGR